MISNLKGTRMEKNLVTAFSGGIPRSWPRPRAVRPFYTILGPLFTIFIGPGGLIPRRRLRQYPADQPLLPIALSLGILGGADL
jgi:hypothetical protein